MIHVPTLFILISIISLSLGSAIRLASSTEPGSGLRELSYGLLLHGTAYAVMLSTAWLGTPVIWVAEMLIALFFVFAIEAMATFHGVRVAKAAYVVFVAAIAMGSAVFSNSVEMRILWNSPMLALSELLILRVLVRQRGVTHGRGQYLVIGAVIVNCLTLIYRTYFAAAGLVHIQTPLDSDVSQAALYLSALVGLIFLSIGFVLMTKERTDHLNQDLILKDKLTGLWNRRKIEEVGEAELLRHVRYGTPASMLMLDLDDFKVINDRFGHVAGDDVLKSLSAICSRTLRDTDMLGRWGGEEFVAVLPGTGVHDAMTIAERIRQAVETIDMGTGQKTTVSIGVALCLSTDTWSSWFERADAALYKAKAGGKNRSSFQLPIVRDNGAARITWGDIFKTGVAELDEDHHEIIQHANELLKRVSSNYDKDDVLGSLELIEGKMLEHFGREESLISRHNPTELLPHSSEHKAIIDRLRFLTERFQSDALPFESLVQFIVFEMCGHHMATEDRAAFRAPSLAPSNALAS